MSTQQTTRTYAGPLDRVVATELIGRGPGGALLLPALSSIATRSEMRPLAERLGDRFTSTLADWPGFGSPVPDGSALSPDTLEQLFDILFAGRLRPPVLGVAAGHAATYLARDAMRHPGRYSHLVLIAPTWRGPLPTMTGGRRPGFCAGARQALEMPALGPALFAVNLSRPVIGWMLREHVYADRNRVTPALVAHKHEVAHRHGARFATAGFVSGGLDPVRSRDAFLALFAGPLPPTLLVRPRAAPRRSAAEMDALAATSTVDVAAVDGSLAAHEENPDGVADAIKGFLAAAHSRDGATPSPAVE